MAVDAIRAGALDFIEKPFRGSEVVQRVTDAIEANALRKRDSSVADLDFPGREPLTRRESDVLATILKGASAKEAGRELGSSHRTIEVHRAKLLEKLGAKNVTDLMRIVFDEGRRRREVLTALYASAKRRKLVEPWGVEPHAAILPGSPVIRDWPRG